jgi:hypothetical protein
MPLSCIVVFLQIVCVCGGRGRGGGWALNYKLNRTHAVLHDTCCHLLDDPPQHT